MRYDPNVAPSPKKWLDLGEDERIELIQQFHRRAGVELPDSRIHAAIHDTVETQLAMDLASVSGALRRLQAEGLDRHEAIHAIGCVLTDQMWLAAQGQMTQGDWSTQYYTALDQLSVESWRRDYGQEPEEEKPKNRSATSSTLTDFQRAQAKQLLAPLCEVPPHAADQLRIEIRFEGPAIVLFEVRPSFMNPREWMEESVAKFRYFKRTGMWRLYCQLRDLEWHAYEPLPESKDLAQLVVEVREDPTGIFWG